MSRILLAPDLHAWYEGPGPVDARIEEWRRCAEVLHRTAMEEACTYALFPGDLFVSNRPSPGQVLAVSHLFSDLHAHLSDVLAIAGNHDVGAPDQPSFVDVLATASRSWGVTRPEVISTPDVGVVCLPWLKGVTEDQLSSILHGLVAQLPDDRPRIVLAHYATDASTYSSGEMAVGREPVLRMAELETLRVDLVVLGHIHRPCVLATDAPTILHTGALTRRDFGEQHDDRMCWVFDTETGRLDDVPLPARRFVTVDGRSTTTVDAELLRDAYVRVTYRATEEEAARIDHDAIAQIVHGAGAFHFAGVFPEIIRTDRGRAEGVTEATEPLAALRTWLDLRSDLTTDARDRVMGAAGELLEAVR